MNLILDGNNTAYRAQQTSELHTKQGEPVGAIYGVINMLNSYLKPSELGYKNHIYEALKKVGVEDTFKRVICAWDNGQSAFRRSIFPEYKGQRIKAREERTEEEKQDRAAFENQMNILHENLPYFSVHSLSKPGWEADDLMYVSSLLASNLGKRSILVSTDKDMLQLVSDLVYVWSPIKGILYTPENFEELTGFKQENYLEFRILDGDSSDNIQGIPGIGLKTAQKLLNEYGSIEGMIQAQEILMKKKTTARIFENIQILDRNSSLMDMRRIPIEHIQQYVVESLKEDSEYDERKVKAFLMEKQFVSILRHMVPLGSALKKLH